MSELAVVVAKPRAESVIEACREAGVYDADRAVREHGPDAVAIPVTEVPDVPHREVVQQAGPARERTLDDRLRARGWTDDEIERAPGSWAVLGSVILVEMGDAPRPAECGAALLDLHHEADTVVDRDSIDGPHREPSVEVIAGTGDTAVVHREHGIAYAFDVRDVMFSPGNKAERARMGEVVEPGEEVLDMFAGIGYFSLPMAAGGAGVTAVERNPDAFRYLLENTRLNDLDDRIAPYRADCRDVAPRVAADRVVMGHYDAHEYLDVALDALVPGGVVHYHETTPVAVGLTRPIERLESAAARDRTIEVLDHHRVKSYSEGVDHLVVDARID
ncbi:class I SAM-dependent methyltransferase [Halococcoides cellulosivorans]|uniref:tRNA(Phe) (4-demethylwyosine(37)-C(7)) aminocarboxypropyltransferase n=1 Tax=Halococcoides cellulosivorans TaxID=1679096 RepID=A0A2R4WYL2_9EURY|nr:class I SAM-dependent methyltransferase family protein [Halococcoides cellulosivorans]AWB26637.1 class I SAM-dependent methyltransferase family protein [Halococcoides cellulosivorans]